MAWNCSWLLKPSLFAYRFPQLLSRGYLRCARTANRCFGRRFWASPCAPRQLRMAAGPLSFNKAFFKECCLEPLTSACISQHTRSWQMWLPSSQADFCAMWWEYVKCFLKINENFTRLSNRPPGEKTHAISWHVTACLGIVNNLFYINNVVHSHYK